jgi:N-acetylmuramoyl-L-alanine amidase
MTDEEVRTRLTHTQVLTCTMVGEADGDYREGNSSVEERIAVGSTVRNRVKRGGWWGRTFKEVCLKKWQFSCWNPGTCSNHRRVMALARRMVAGEMIDQMAFETLYLAEGIITGIILDRVNGADHYYAPKAMVPKGSAPKWAYTKGGVLMRPDVIVGDQHFYNLAARAKEVSG